MGWEAPPVIPSTCYICKKFRHFFTFIYSYFTCIYMYIRRMDNTSRDTHFETLATTSSDSVSYARIVCELARWGDPV